jgi:hypothetical protein
LPADKQAELNSQYDEFSKAETAAKQKSTARKIKDFLVENGIAVARGLTVEALKMILMAS